VDIGDQIRLHPSPVGKLVAAGTANLISKKLDRTVVNPVIVWFENAFLVPVYEPNQASVLDRRPE
jgi:hypothetical protein